MMAARKTRRAPSDGGLVPAILSYLATQQDVIEAQRVNSGGKKIGEAYVRFAKPGSLDVRGYFRASPHALAFEIEAKTKTGKLNPNQLKRIADVLEPGNIPWCVARSITDVIVFLGDLRMRARAQI